VQLIKDLPEPPRLKATIDDYVRGSRHLSRQVVAEEFKLRYHFGGHTVLSLRTAEGLGVIFAGRAGDPNFRAALDSLTPEQHRLAVTRVVEPWEEADFIPEDSGSDGAT
jgi:hypothetical protein